LLTETNWQSLLDRALLPQFTKSSRLQDSTDPALARLLARNPERLLTALGATLNAHGGLNDLPAMARLVLAAGEPVLGALESHLNDPRRNRTATAIKLLAATEPHRLVDALPRTLPAWDWNLQDLAVAELTRRDASAKPDGIARAFTELLPDVHPLVAPVMLDEIGLSGDDSAVPLLCRIASGSMEQLRDVFIRIKAIEALGSMRATAAADLLRTLLRQRQGLVHTEPAGLQIIRRPHGFALRMTRLQKPTILSRARGVTSEFRLTALTPRGLKRAWNLAWEFQPKRACRFERKKVSRRHRLASVQLVLAAHSSNPPGG
jgi:hypothetical protein